MADPAGANMMTKASTPLTEPSFCIGKIIIATVNIKGRMIPVPIPCTILPNRTIPKLLPRPDTTDPHIKANKAKIVNCRVENHLVKKLAIRRFLGLY